MLSRTALKPRKRNAPRPAWKVADAFGQWLRGRPCACQGRNPACKGPIQAAHVPAQGEQGHGDALRRPIPDTAQRGVPFAHSAQEGLETFAERFLGGAIRTSCPKITGAHGPAE
jgi:hypothetical protein